MPDNATDQETVRIVAAFLEAWFVEHEGYSPVDADRKVAVILKRFSYNLKRIKASGMPQ